ncbi:MAG: DEAD/DEAH box helicase [Candidatus Marinimicrobia bacterium]|nr:DEAD/DEAH box helicase [Candidatus Neomarinimicrobiota bacterium]
MSFNDLGLKAELMRAVSAQNYSTPTPIQVQAIPAILQGKDVQAGAQTGTGKTAAFTLPMLQMLDNSSNGSRHHPRALVITPTRELAAQVHESIRTYGKYLPLRSVVVFGGVGFRPQADKLKQGVDVIVATPGRLLDHAKQRTVNLSKVEFLVLDEADRMLNMGFMPDVRRIINLLPKKRQNLLFSATYVPEIQKLADSLLTDPARIEVSPKKNAATDLVTQVVHPVARSKKRALLSHLIRTEKWDRALVFTRTKRGADRLTKQLVREGVSTQSIHGDKSQSARTKALADFKKGKVRILVATDIAARGLDISELPRVVNYDIPQVPEDYVHRIGRTGRAGSNGMAISLVCSDEGELLTAIEQVLQQQIPIKIIEGFRDDARQMSRSTAHPAAAPTAQPAARPMRPGRRPASGRRGRRRV